jgi:hypothetical protein
VEGRIDPPSSALRLTAKAMKADAEKGALLLAERAVGGHRDAQPCDQGVAIGIAAKCGRAPPPIKMSPFASEHPYRP